MQLAYQRQGRQYTARLTPQKSLSDSRWHLGLWVRDSSAGIGTVTYFDENARTFSGLGHPICDVDTGEIMTLSTGEGVEAVITGHTTGKSGSPGELKGQFVAGAPLRASPPIANAGSAGPPPGLYPQGAAASGFFARSAPAPLKCRQLFAGSDVVIRKVLGQRPRGAEYGHPVTDEALLQKNRRYPTGA